MQSSDNNGREYNYFRTGEQAMWLTHVMCAWQKLRTVIRVNTEEEKGVTGMSGNLTMPRVLFVQMDVYVYCISRPPGHSSYRSCIQTYTHIFSLQWLLVRLLIFSSKLLSDGIMIELLKYPVLFSISAVLGCVCVRCVCTVPIVPAHHEGG